MADKASDRLFNLVIGNSPIVATAIHSGHAIREEIIGQIALSDAERFREEDPFTDEWTEIAPTQFVAYRSRFETDLNRPRDKAIYRRPEDAWGLHVWRSPPSALLVEKLLFDYDTAYTLLQSLLTRLIARHRRVVVLDLHSYNHRREGPQCAPADPESYPDVNIGTGTMDRTRWAAVVDRFIHDLKSVDVLGGRLDVRENVCFQGGNMSRWIHEIFPDSACSIAVEVKKFFMDEWTGEPDRQKLVAIRKALASTVPGILRELRSADE